LHNPVLAISVAQPGHARSSPVLSKWARLK
jgi:hypothetical protein